MTEWETTRRKSTRQRQVMWQRRLSNLSLAWRRKIYTGPYPKSVVGVGTRADGGSYLVMLTSYGVAGVEVARQLKAMGCTEALGGDDDTSTQAVWRGTPVAGGNVRPVPDALAVYLRD